MNSIEIDKDRLYNLLPYVYKLRDAEQGEPMRELLQVISEQVSLIDQNIAQMYENWFIETCEDWVVPYLGDLIGYTPVHEAGEPSKLLYQEGQLKNKILIPRREIANTIQYRRRKGTLALLEQLANDVAGWPARAIEFYKLLAWAQHINHLHMQRGRSVNLRENAALNKLNSPFDRLAHHVDVRRINSSLTQDRFNIPSVGLYVWRLKSYSVTEAPAISLEQRNCYTFSVLGNQVPLYTHWQPELESTEIAGPLNLPMPVSRFDFTELTSIGKVFKPRASSIYYGADKSIIIWAENWPEKGPMQPIPREKIIPADLTDWDRYRPLNDTVAVDPVLGRILFPPNHPPKSGVKVSYCYGFSADIGGGEYSRTLSQPNEAKIYQVGLGAKLKTITEAIEKWQADFQKSKVDTESQKYKDGVIEITDSGLYEEPLKIELLENQSLQIRAAVKKRPTVLLSDRPEQFMVTGAHGSYLTLDGLLIAGRGLEVDGPIAGIVIRHSTLVPGWSLKPNCDPTQLGEPSLEITNTNPCITIEHSIVGSIKINIDEVGLDPLRIRISDSILDATGTDCDGIACEAIGAFGRAIAPAVLEVKRSTVFGHMDIHAIELAENSIFMGKVRVARRQLGCMRFCYVTPNSRTPKRYHCQPDLLEQQAEGDLKHRNSLASKDEIEKVRINARTYARPQFNSMRYGQPSYCQLAKYCPAEIKRGADDESEMGVFHDLFQPQREANLCARLEEYVPSRADVGIIFSS